MIRDTFRGARFTSVSEVTSVQWDECDPGASVFMSHAWLTASERDPVAERTYIVVLDSQGQLAGALPCIAPRVDFNPRYDVRSLFGDDTLPRAKQLLFLGSIESHHSSVLVNRRLSLADRERVKTLLFERACELGNDVGRLPLMLYSAERSVEATQSGLLDAEASIQLPGEREEDWLASLRSKRRVQVRHEMKRFADAGWTVHEEPLTEIADQGSELVSKLQEKYGERGSARTVKSGLQRRHESLSTNEVSLAARLDGRLGGFALGYRRGSELWVRVAGFDYDMTASDYVYFNLVYYSTLKFAYQHGVQELHFGLGSLRAKVLRGASLRPLGFHTFGWTISDRAVAARRESVMASMVESTGVPDPRAPALFS